MKDLLGDPVSPAPAMDAPLPWCVFQLDDYEWWLARTKEEAIAAYTENCGEVPEEDDVHQLSEAELERFMYHDSLESGDAADPATKRAFAVRLRERVAEGVSEPELFATTEC